MLKTTSPGLNSFKSTIPSFGVVRRAYGTSPKEYSDAIIDRYGDPLADVYNKLKKEKSIGFISDGKPLVSSVSANNIVGFNRNIKPRPNNLQSIISNLSSSIFNNFKDNVTSSSNNLSQISGDYATTMTVDIYGRDDSSTSAAYYHGAEFSAEL